eukprot:974484-Rhodomonas_salina.1
MTAAMLSKVTTKQRAGPNTPPPDPLLNPPYNHFQLVRPSPTHPDAVEMRYGCGNFSLRCDA